MLSINWYRLFMKAISCADRAFVIVCELLVEEDSSRDRILSRFCKRDLTSAFRYSGLNGLVTYALAPTFSPSTCSVICDLAVIRITGIWQ